MVKPTCLADFLFSFVINKFTHILIPLWPQDIAPPLKFEEDTHKTFQAQTNDKWDQFAIDISPTKSTTSLR